MCGIYHLVKSIVLKHEPNSGDEFEVLDRVHDAIIKNCPYC